MSCTVDHLHSDAKVRVLRDFVDANGVKVSADTLGVVRGLKLDWASQQIVMRWESGPQPKELRFPLMNASGPGNGRMKEYFEVLGRVEVPRPAKRQPGTLPPREIPEVGEECRDPSELSAATERVWALAARNRFPEAEAQMRIILNWPDEYGGVLTRAAGDLVAAARSHYDDPDPAVYNWLRQRSLSLWYSWGACATSGGEGAARSVEISAAESRLPART